jgi:hypothetical protein
MSPTELADRVTEHDFIRRWRLEALKRAGFSPSDALVMSGRTEVDVHVAAKLLQDGCPVATALRILL